MRDSNRVQLLRIVFLFLSSAGMFNALYLSLEHFYRSVPTCIVFAGCDLVLTSSYAFVLGMPLAYLGLAFYTVVFALAFLMAAGYGSIYFRLALFLVGVGVVASLTLFYVQAVLLGAFCAYCVLSEIIIVGLAVIAALLLYEERKRLRGKK